MSLSSASRLSPGDSIAEIARNVATVFARGRAKQLDPHLRSELENELGRFKIWAGSLGVFAPGRASADYRLRDDDDVKEVLIQMLDRLRQSTKQAMDPPVILEEEEENEQDDSSSESSEDSMAISLDKDSDVGSDTDDIPVPQNDVVATALETIKDTINRLYRLSTIIKKPSSSNENVKVANFIAKEEESENLKEFQTSVSWQIKFRLPDASPALLDRLIEAAVFRRKKLEYRERHKEKLRQGVEQSFAADLTVLLLPKDTKLRLLGYERKATPVMRQQSGSARGSLNTIQYSATEASSVNRLKFASYPKSVAPSGITKSAIARREHLDIPGPPSKSKGESKEVVCPYCFRIVDKEDMVQARWKRHILRDIEPYVCLFDGCEKSIECFATVDDWINHMQWQHAVVWCCQVGGHESTIYHSEEDFKQHLRQEHENSFNESQLSMIVKKAAQPVQDLFGTLALTLNENERGDERAGACPLCPFSVEISEDNQVPDSLEVAKTSRPASKKLCDHIAAHMEAIALLSLPERDDLDDADTNERESVNTYQSLDQNAMDLPPVASIIDNENDEATPDPIQPPTELESSEYMSRDDWNYVFEDQRVNSGQDLEPAQDPTLQEFVRRARRAEMFRRWKIDRIPSIVVYNPDGLEIRPVVQENSASFLTDDVPSIIVSREGDSQDASLNLSEAFPSINVGSQREQEPPGIVLHTPSGFSVIAKGPD
ncbi:95dec5dc-9321-4a63-a1f5-995e7d561e74 [Sclerotinia trifoliorum]|uniref:95dec5dc-9321-4a63-a1f5-995e7d561e74 n=1 Tax=Sclerotinia trifoliorum TaxID=28548 RepID=A0A8H2ZK58_9HELO|nr:95dec5dc-9321-4a63-a1f5-995e7d561e74 [Sclerotinia trifoliorum]